ncbi:hypothetical protein PIIN_00267 [Serendipita indica DSM 11827]|uniref:PUB domain-containing protein n=1 Tax=Serendipita indica (strain DSM 11827) TaxID=1109443 RepID=G4T5L3_SERID|nr:hypothetical protein PIIN_00267 [Serendipita indica DSM 11827]
MQLEEPTTDQHAPESARNAIAEAIARRALSAAPEDEDERRFVLERDTRQEFRRLIDPGIARGSSPATLEATLKMLSTIADNLLREPDNEKYQRFKPTNSLIKKNLVEVKGAIEYAVALGFRAEVIHFQPYYSFMATPANLNRLRIGAAVLHESLDRIIQKAEQEKLNRVDPKAVQKEIAQKVKMAYEDDRKEKKRRDEMEKQARSTRVTGGTRPISTSKRPPIADYRPGPPGRTIGEKTPEPTEGDEANEAPEQEQEDGDEDEDDEYDEAVMSRMPLKGGYVLGRREDEKETEANQAT